MADSSCIYVGRLHPTRVSFLACQGTLTGGQAWSSVGDVFFVFRLWLELHTAREGGLVSMMIRLGLRGAGERSRW